MSTKPLKDVVHQIVAEHGPILGRDVEKACVALGYNGFSVRAYLFNAKKGSAKTGSTLVKDANGFWTAPVKAPAA